MDEQDLTHKNLLPAQQHWREFESNRLLLEPRSQMVSIVLRLVATAALVMYAPLVWVAVWVILIFGTNFWMRNYIRVYSKLLRDHPFQNVMTPALDAVVSGYKNAWYVNCLIWGLLSFLAQFWLPDAPRLVCVVILNALMFLSITRTYVDCRMMHRVSALLVVTQFVFVLLRFLFYKGPEFGRLDETSRFLAYIFYFSLMLYLLWVVGDRFHLMHKERLDSQYAELQLIETLNQSKAQLHLEQQALLASNKLVQQFYSGAAHDLRQPVYAMQLYTSMMAEDPSLNKVLLPKITQSCIAIDDMFNTLFDYQKTHINDTELAEKDSFKKRTFS